MHNKKITNIVIFGAVLVILMLGLLSVSAQTSEQSYTIGSNGSVVYKESENKIYYTRKHFSTGSGIRYYTQYFVISLKEATLNDDLSRLDEKYDDMSVMLQVSGDGKGIKVGEADKSLSFYWYDSEIDDDGYITTTYVIDGSIIWGLIDSAAGQGKYGDVYIHHVFAVTGGDNNDSWHSSYNVENNSPYFVYSELLELEWNNTEATHNSQTECLNIYVPFKKTSNVNTAYYDEYGNIVKQENKRAFSQDIWEKNVPGIIMGYDGREYISVEPGTVRDYSNAVMRAYYIWNTDPALSSVFPSWSLETDRDYVNGNSVKIKIANDNEGLPGGFKNRGDNTYFFNVAGSEAVDVILYIPVIEYKENDLVKVYRGYYDADTKETIKVPEHISDIASGTELSIDADVPEGYEVNEDEIYYVYGENDILLVLKNQPQASLMRNKASAEYKKEQESINVREVPETENIVIWISVKKIDEKETEGDPEKEGNPDEETEKVFLNPNVTVKYFSYDENLGKYIWLMSEVKLNSQDITGKFQYSSSCSVELRKSISNETGSWQIDFLGGILYGDDAAIFQSGKIDFFELINNENPEFVLGTVPGILNPGNIVEFETADKGKYYTVFIYCKAQETENDLILKYFDVESGEIIYEKTDYNFFDGSKLAWHGVGGKLVWALPVAVDNSGSSFENAEYIPVFCQEDYGIVHTGKCSSEEIKHTFYGFGTGNIDMYYCMTCGKLKRAVYYINNQWEPGADTVIYDNGYSSDSYHSYTDYGTEEDNPIKASFYFGQRPSGMGKFETSYQNSQEMLYSYDNDTGTLWIKISETLTDGDSVMSVYPEKVSNISAGIIYIPCVKSERKEPVSIVVIENNTEYVQRIDARHDVYHIVTGISKSYGSEGHEYDSCDFSLYIEGYDESVLVSFGFDVCTKEGLRLKADSWNRVYSSYYVPEDVKEGIYTVRTASFSESGEKLTEDEAEIMISGKIYGLELISINSGFNDFYNVFIKDEKCKNIYPDEYEDGIFETDFYEDKRYHYGTGLKNELGLLKKNNSGDLAAERYVLPLLDGSSPQDEMAGMLKSGYTWTFSIITQGSIMAEDETAIKVIPRFWWISPDGSDRKEVDLWYSGVKDGKNVNYIKKDEDGIYFVRNAYEVSDLNRTTWLLDYSLPDIWHCTEKGFDLEGYIERTGGCTFEEDFFFKEGYLIVNLEICAYDKNQNLVMTYSNTEENILAGMCDMWKMEGFTCDRTDIYGNSFSLEEGDVIIVRLPGSTFNPSTGLYYPPTNISEENTVIRKNPDDYSLNR